MTDVDINQKLQHPRRSLGNRHRSQAEKFLKMEKNLKNLNWAEQSAKQSVLYDFTIIVLIVDLFLRFKNLSLDFGV